MSRLSTTKASKKHRAWRGASKTMVREVSTCRNYLEAALAALPNVRVVIDPSVLGGLVAQIGDTVIDGSVRRRLDLLKQAI